MKQTLKTIIFDLDGTIYQNTTFHRDYIHYLVQDSKWTPWEAPLISFADQVLAGDRLFMNRFYHIEQANPSTPEEFFSLLEQRLHPCLAYAEALKRHDLLYLGDAWALVTFIGESLGLLAGERRDSVYRMTRKRMEERGMGGSEALKTAIQELVHYYDVILMSNSYEETALELLKQLGYDQVFPTIISSANKPFDFIKKLDEFNPSILEHPEGVLSIGDHAYNDLMPIRERGGLTVWLNPFKNVFRPACNRELSTLDDLTVYLHTLIERAKRAS